MKIPITGGIGATAVSLVTATTTTVVSDDEDVIEALTRKSVPLVTTGIGSSLSLYNGYSDVSIELAERYIGSLSDDELYELEAKLSNKDINIDVEETYGKRV